MTLLSRRQLLRIGGMTLLGTTIATGLVVNEWWNAPPSEPYLMLSTHEAEMIEAISKAAFPSGEVIEIPTGELQLPRFFDLLIQAMPETQAKLLKLLINTLNSAPYLTLNAAFLEQSAEQQSQQLQMWLNHSNHLVRNAVTSLTILIGMGYTSHPQISSFFAQYHQCGYGDE